MNIFVGLPQCNYVVLQVVSGEDEQICLEGLEVEHTDQQYYNIQRVFLLAQKHLFI